MVPTSAEGRRSWYLRGRGLAAAVVALAGVAILSSTAHASPLPSGAGSAGQPGSPSAALTVKHHVAPPWHAANGHVRTQATTTAAPTSSVSVTDPPGNVYYVAPPKRSVSAPFSDPADLTSASASDNGTTLTFTAQTVAMQDPYTNANWTNDDTYIGWQLDTNGGTDPNYEVYFQVNPDGTPDGELAFEFSGDPISCAVTLTYSATAGYQASLAAACLPGVTSFAWNVFTNYDTEPMTVDPDGKDAFGKALPDPFDGGATYAPVVTAPTPRPVVAAAGAVSPSYWLFARDGGVFTFGNAPFDGSLGATKLAAPIVGGTGTLDGKGYFMVGADGGVFAYGDARFAGSAANLHLDAPVVNLTPDPVGDGYWLASSDGGVFAYGGARYLGSMGGRFLAQPVVGMAAANEGGYWLFARDGGVFSFGDAPFYGSMAGTNLAAPIVGGVATPDGKGYWLVAADGGVFAFGDASFYGSMAGTKLVAPMTGIVPTPDGKGYWTVAADGGVFAFGDAPFLGSMGGHVRMQPVVSLAVSS